MTAIAPRQPEPRSAAGRRAVLVLAVMIALGAAGYGDEKPIPEVEGKKAQAEAARVAVALSEAVGLRRPIETLVGTVAATSKWSSPAKKTPPRVSVSSSDSHDVILAQQREEKKSTRPRAPRRYRATSPRGCRREHVIR